MDLERIGNGTGLINPNSKDFQLIRKAIAKEAAKMSPEDRRQLHIRGMIYKMEAYLDDDLNEPVVWVGECLKELIEQMGIPHKDFATYIGIKHSNLSAIYSGRRRINQDLASKLGQIFSMEPSLWLQVQSKSELEAFQLEKGKAYEAYSLEKLLKKYGS